MSLLRPHRYSRKPKHYLRLPICWLLGHSFIQVKVREGTPQQRIYTNGCHRCWAEPPVHLEEGLERKPVG